MSPRTSIPRSYPSMPERPTERPDRRAERPTSRPTLEPVPIRQVDAVDLGIGLEDFAVARRGEDLDVASGIGGAEPGKDRAGEDRVAHVVELDDQDLAGRSTRRAGRKALQIAIRIDPTASSRPTEIRHRHLV